MNNPTLPPIIPARPRHSIFHQAATASAFAPLVAIGITIVASAGGTSLDHQSQRPAALIAAIASSIIILLGLLCGIVALFGIRRHGKKGILVKALCGIIVPVLLSALAIPNFMAARAQAIKKRQYQSSPEGQVSALAERINQQGSKMVDEVTRLEGAEALPNRTLLYKYSLITKSASEIPTDALDRVVRPDIVKKYNTLPEMKMFRDNGVTLVYRYRDKEGQMIGDISVGPSDLAR